MAMQKPFISAIICTLDQPDSLQRTVASLSHQTLAPDAYEIIVVINGTKPRLSFPLASPAALTFAREARIGLSLARNKGLDTARAQLVTFIDDDAIAHPQWLERLLRSFAQDAAIVSVGGRIIPAWQSPRPIWLLDYFLKYYSCMDLGACPRFLKPGQFLVGTNMAFKKEILQQCQGFSQRLGRKGSNLMSCEEWPIFDYIDRLKLKKYYCPEAVVEHIIKPERMTIPWLLRRILWQVISDVRYCYFFGSSKKDCLKRLLNLGQQLYFDTFVRGPNNLNI